MASATHPSNARFSTYSGAPSLQPSLAPTFTTTTSDAPSQYRTSHLHPRGRDIEKMYSATDPAAQASTSTLSNSTDPKAADIKSWSGALQRMQDERLEKQRFVMNENKSDEVAKLALSAKVERALARRMVGQDATFSTSSSRDKKAALDAEKRSLQVEAR